MCSKVKTLVCDVQELTESIENMNARSLNYWLCKFLQEVANKSGWRLSDACPCKSQSLDVRPKIEFLQIFCVGQFVHSDNLA